MLYIFLVLVFLILVTKLIYIQYTNKLLLDLVKNDELDRITKNLPCNKDICNEILNQLDNKNVKIDFCVDKKSTTSFYNVFNNTILLADGKEANETFARVMFISHECWHSKQNKKFLWYNFILANISLVYLFISVLLIWFNLINQNQFYIMFTIYIILNMFVYFARNVIESDATYMAYIISKEYLEKKYNKEIVDKITNKYKEILIKGTSNFLFGLITNNFIMIIVYMLLGLFKGWW